jgi:hypothetical protein
MTNGHIPRSQQHKAPPLRANRFNWHAEPRDGGAASFSPAALRLPKLSILGANLERPQALSIGWTDVFFQSDGLPRRVQGDWRCADHVGGGVMTMQPFRRAIVAAT